LSEQIVAIVANGEVVQASIARPVLQSARIIIAADGGALTCKEAGVAPHYIIGDGDSLTGELREYFSGAELVKRSDQYSTDLEKAIAFARTLSPTAIVVLSALGKRSDHSAANLLFLAELNQTIPVKIYDNHGMMTILNPGRHDLAMERGRLVSFFSYGRVNHLTLAGFRYPLSRESYPNYFVGISNVCESNRVEVQFDSGILFMYEVLIES